MTLTADTKASSDDDIDEATDDSSDEATDEADEAQDCEPDPEAEVGDRTWVGRPLVAALIAICVGALAASGVLGWMVYQERQLERSAHDAQQAAVAYAQILTSIDSTRVDENFQQVLDGATGEFKDMYSQSSVQLRQLLIDNNAAAHGVVVDSAVQSVEQNKVVVLLFVDQSVTNAAVPDPRIDRSRIRMTLEFVDGRWRTSKVELP